MKSAPSLPARNFSCLTRLDHDRLKGMVARRLTVAKQQHAPGPSCPPVAPHNVRNSCIWGNHSSTQVPCVDFAEVQLSHGAKWLPAREALADEDWIDQVGSCVLGA
jgi:malate dehydrogenase